MTPTPPRFREFHSYREEVGNESLLDAIVAFVQPLLLSGALSTSYLRVQEDWPEPWCRAKWIAQRKTAALEEGKKNELEESLFGNREPLCSLHLL